MNVVKKEPTLHLVDEALLKALQDFCAPTIEAVCTIPGKNDRIVAMNELLASMREAIRPQFAEMEEEDFNRDTNTAFDDYFRTVTRRLILEKHYRQDGRGIFDIRPLSAEVAVLPVVHGSSLFSRGETQAMVIATLGNEKDSLMSDNITNGEGFTNKRFYLHYNFPNYSVGEVGRISGPGRREIGHGDLAERSVSKVVPKDFPYVVRCVSEIMGSNGSTSMASVSCFVAVGFCFANSPITRFTAPPLTEYTSQRRTRYRCDCARYCSNSVGGRIRANRPSSASSRQTALSNSSKVSPWVWRAVERSSSGGSNELTK
jgi:polyribonucleotide nucleotidyltransferase